MSGRLRTACLVIGVSVGMCLAVAAASAQRGGGGGSRGGGMAGGGMGGSPTRLVVLTATLKLDDGQKAQAKTVLDAEFKSAAPARKALTAARETLGAAIQAGKDQAEIDRAVAAYATQVTAMAVAEAQALAKIVRTLTPEQQANTSAVQTAVSLMRGAFIGKKWDTVPDVRFY